MPVIVETITAHNHVNYQAFIRDDHPSLQQNPNLIVLGISSQQEPVGVITIEVKGEKSILIDYNVKQTGRSETVIGNKVVEQVEKLLYQRGIQYIFCFHSDKEPLNEIVKSRNWRMDKNQLEYTINPSELLKSSIIPKPPHGFDVVRFDSIDKPVLSHLIATINQQVNRDVDQLPPVNLINHATSAFLIHDQKVIGWFLSSLQLKQNETVLSIERFWIKPDFREYKVSVRFIKHMIGSIYKENNYQKLAFNLMSENFKLTKVIKNGFLGEVQYEGIIFRSYKKLGGK